MDKSENLKDFDEIYLLVCKILRKQGKLIIPTRDEFRYTYIKFCQLMEGHKNLLVAIGKL